MPPKPWPDQHDRAPGPTRSRIEQPGALGDGDDIVAQRGGVVFGRRRVRQSVSAQVEGDRPDGAAEPPGHRRPAPGRPGQAVDEEDARRTGPVRATPVEEVDPLAGRQLDDEPVRLGDLIRRRRERGEGVGRQVHRT